MPSQSELEAADWMGQRARACIDIVCKRINKGRIKEHKAEFVHVSASDFAELMFLELRCIRLKAQLEVGALLTTSEKFVYERRLQDAEWEIAKRDLQEEGRDSLEDVT